MDMLVAHSDADLRTRASFALCTPLAQVHDAGVTDRADFLAWFEGPLTEAEFALHNGDPGPRRALWSRNEPVSVLGAWRNAIGQQDVQELFAFLGDSFSNCTASSIEVLACDVVGDMAYTASLEHTSASVDG